MEKYFKINLMTKKAYSNLSNKVNEVFLLIK